MSVHQTQGPTVVRIKPMSELSKKARGYPVVASDLHLRQNVKAGLFNGACVNLTVLARKLSASATLSEVNNHLATLLTLKKRGEMADS